MKRIKDIILSDKAPMNKNSLWLKDGNLKYFEGVWKDIDTSKMSTNTSDIILDDTKRDDIEYLKNFIKQGETWAKNNGTYILHEDLTATFSFPVLLIFLNIILTPSVAYSIDNKIIVFPKSQDFPIPVYTENQVLTTEEAIITGMVKQTSNIPVLSSNATLATVINAYNTLLTKLQDTGIMAKK